MPNFTESSEATRAWPQVGFSCAICTMSLRMFSGIRGRPACDFHFHNNLKPLRCQPIKVSGLTMTKASFQSQRRDQRMRQTRAESFNRLGWGLSLLIEGQLLSQEQDLRAQSCARAEQQTEEKKPVRDQITVSPAEKCILPGRASFLSFLAKGSRKKTSANISVRWEPNG